MVDATVKSGIARQVEAFKSGFDQVLLFVIGHCIHLFCFGIFYDLIN